MAEERKQTIVNEIRYWKKNRLLPKEYCDFLLALYTEGEGKETLENETVSKKNKRIPWNILMMTFTLFLLPLSFLVIYFTEMDMIMQTGLLSSFVALSIVYSRRLKKKSSDQFHIPLIISILISLLLSVSLVHEQVPNNWSVYVVITIHCAIWAVIGRRLKLPYLLISSCIGIIVLLVIIVS
ncbi:hypothetical protein [Halobacillus salinus]|uniref:hypothetical protein n=1 Tax=Halobacillus salinus TaxID=192814 RepID=UPI0009A59843|nr:hypothetical protein [Halobacillus salinus]